MSLKVIPVVLACDNHYVAHLAVVIASTLAVGHKDNVYDFYVLDGGIHESNQQILQTFLKKHTNARLTFLDVRSSFTDVILTTLPLATFLRLTLPEALTGLDKIVYLDTDLIVMKDVGVL